MYTLESLGNIKSKLVHSRDYNDMSGPLNQKADPVAVPVDIYKLSVLREGVGAHQKIVGHHLPRHHFTLFFRCSCICPLDKRVIAGSDRVKDSAFI